MQRSAVWFLLVLLVLLSAALTACGGGKSSSTVGTPASITVSPSSASLDLGNAITLSATVLDANGNVASNPAPLTYSSSNTAVATVSKAGAVCAGTWDANNVVCTPGSVGSATITVTSGSLSATVPIAAHLHIDRLTITPSSIPLLNCKSQGQTTQLTAQALNNGSDITNTVGSITWTTDSASVATVDSNGVVTAVAPGQTSIRASVGSINSVPASFTTCPVQTIRVHMPTAAAETFFSLATGATQQLAADVVDSAGVPVSANLTWASSQTFVANVTSTGLVTATQPGTTAITATCSLNCNLGLLPVYGDAVTGTVSGTSANAVLATGTGTTSLVPIDTATNAAGTAVTLPAAANSMVVNGLGTNAFLGSSGGLITLTTSNNTTSNDTSHPGTIVAISPNGNFVLVASASSVFMLNNSDTTRNQTFSIGGVTAAAFTSDSARAILVAGNLVWSVTTGGAAASVTEPSALTGVAVLASGAFAYVGSAASVFALATCNNGPADTVPSPGTLLASLPNGNAILAVDSPSIDVITPNSALAGCPPVLSDTRVPNDFLQGPFTARQLIVLPDSSKAYVTSDLGMLLVYDVANGKVLSPIPLAGGASAFTGGATLDSKSVYVGGSDNAVHRIDVASGTDAQQIPLSFKPDLVAVRPK